MVTIPLKKLPFEVNFLIAITSALRMTELGALSVKKGLCVIYEIIICQGPTFILKVKGLFFCGVV